MRHLQFESPLRRAFCSSASHCLAKRFAHQDDRYGLARFRMHRLAYRPLRKRRQILPVQRGGDARWSVSARLEFEKPSSDSTNVSTGVSFKF